MVLLFAGVVGLTQTRYPGFDPDQWYHKALSRIWTEGGFPLHLMRTLPQAEDVGWGKQFYEKEFLFHVLTTAGYVVGGDRGVEWAAHAAALGIFVLLFMALASRFGRVRALAIVISLAVLHPVFSYRMTLVRPHVLAVFWFLSLAFSLWRSSAFWAAVSAAGFALAYHAVYLPVILLGMAFWLENVRARSWRAPVAGLAGFVIGILANPYFPTNLVMGWLHLRFIFEPPLPDVMAAGSELGVYSRTWFMILFLPYLAMLSAYGWVIFRKRRNLTPEAVALMTVAIFWLMTMKIQRAAEYAIPLTLAAVAVCQRDLFSRRREPLRTWAVLLWAVVLLEPLALYAGQYRQKPDPTYAAITESVREALRLPEAGEKVLNCNWAVGSLILYDRPDLRFVDLLDPRFLRQWNPLLFNRLAALKTGGVENTYEVITHDFRARYVLCGHGPLNDQLARDPRFQELYRAADSPIRLFAVEG